MQSAALQTPGRSRNLRVALILVAFVLGMGGLAYAAVPLYALFCRVTGFGGTTQVASGNPKGLIAREMTVRFDATVDNGLAWRVVPATPVTGPIGTIETIIYRATNLGTREVTGQAIFNVTPGTAGIYFNKIECFCFTQQTLKPGESIDMPVSFFVDPDIAENDELDTVREMTLSYTFYAQRPEDSSNG
jgi:cytochrome c oxidase assembly protein subunit 11